ncbi:HalOD1 output domain-containing protein [Haloarcula salinisoli]|uniref:Halobacterial output domain-containing protein n=1 Tax=Haloarcula salinisoli TaxID=2487746 RepID=A0A8J7YGM2_9EURY|nr:HalOD1 output domain-containing protein [Halomicroarcula salinisoli]MBX0305152.1 hypothetical protein [Halomicroarcula salinisoli]
MTDQTRFHYEPGDAEPLSTAIVSAVAIAHNENVLDQKWILANDINPDALDALFFDGKPNMRLTFEADASTVTVDVDDQGQFDIEIESHR